MKKDKKDEITVVVNGEEVEVAANDNATLQSILQKALKESGNEGRPEGDWNFFDREGNELSKTSKIGAFPAGFTFFLNLKVGAGG